MPPAGDEGLRMSTVYKLPSWRDKVSEVIISIGVTAGDRFTHQQCGYRPCVCRPLNSVHFHVTSFSSQYVCGFYQTCVYM